MSYKLEHIKYETKDFFVLIVGKKGFEVYQTGICHATRKAQIGHGEGLGLDRAIKTADKLQTSLDKTRVSTN